MMVNTEDVRSLLIRLGSELHAISETKTPGKATSFASSLSAEIDRTETVAPVGGAKNANLKILETPTPSRSSQTVQGQTLSLQSMSTDSVSTDEAKAPATSNAGDSAAQGAQNSLSKKTAIRLEHATFLETPRDEVKVASNVVSPTKEDSTNTGRIPGDNSHGSLRNELKAKFASRSKERNAKAAKSIGTDLVPVAQPVSVMPQSVAADALAAGNVPTPGQSYGATEGAGEDASGAKAEVKVVGTRSRAGSTSIRMTSTSHRPNQPLQVKVESKVEQEKGGGESEPTPFLVASDSEAATPLKKPTTTLRANEVAAVSSQPLVHGLHASTGNIVKGTAGNITDSLRSMESEPPSVMLRGVASASDHMIAATPSTLEVGVANGSHGWVRIRAELTESGEIKASLTSNSAVGEGMLHRELPALSSFLHEEKLTVANIVVHQASAGDFFANTGDRGGAGYFQQQSSRDSPAGKETLLAADQQAETNFGDRGGEPITQRIGSNAGGGLSVRA